MENMTIEKKNQGGRPKGSQSKETLRRKAIALRVEAKLTASKSTPLEIFAKVMQGDQSITERMLDAAKAAAPYMHPRLSAVTMNANIRRSVTEYSDDELAALAGDGEDESEG